MSFDDHNFRLPEQEINKYYIAVNPVVGIIDKLLVRNSSLSQQPLPENEGKILFHDYTSEELIKVWFAHSSPLQELQLVFDELDSKFNIYQNSDLLSSVDSTFAWVKSANHVDRLIYKVSSTITIEPESSANIDNGYYVSSLTNQAVTYKVQIGPFGTSASHADLFLPSTILSSNIGTMIKIIYLGWFELDPDEHGSHDPTGLDGLIIRTKGDFILEKIRGGDPNTFQVTLKKAYEEVTLLKYDTINWIVI
jgi:hypothetical protein